MYEEGDGEKRSRIWMYARKEEKIIRFNLNSNFGIGTIWIF
jgi:hypothetical protein